MADRNEIFRIILEGRDRLSGTLDNVTKSVGKLDDALGKLKKNKIEEFPLFGGGKAARGPGGQFIKAEEISRLDTARRKIDEINRSLQNLRKGRLSEGEFALFGGGRASRGEGGRFVRAADLTLTQKFSRELKNVSNVIGEIQNKAKRGILGGGTQTFKQDPASGQFVTNLTSIGRFVKGIQKASRQINDANEKANQSIKDNTKEIVTNFQAGFKAAQNTAKIIRENTDKQSQEFKIKKIQLKENEELEKVALRAEQQRRRTQILRALADRREASELEIDELRAHIRELGNTEEEFEEKNAIRAEIRRVRRQRREEERIRRENLTARFQSRRAAIEIDFNEQRRLLDRPDFGQVEEQVKRLRKEAVNAETAIGRFGQRAGLAFGDVVRGARSARKGINEIDNDVKVLNNVFHRFGLAFGSIFKNFDQLVNLRWLFITGIVSTFLTVIVQLGTALVALSASAIQAGAALGGALAAGAAQAFPVVGLLAAAFSRFNAALDAVKLSEKVDTGVEDRFEKIRSAGQRLEDQQYSLARAIESVGDAQYSLRQSNKNVVDALKAQRQAAKDLAEARRQASRDIVDANLEERDAALSLREAELGVLEAKQRLREEEEKKKKGAGDLDEARAVLREANERLKIAKTQADESEISGAQHQVTIAQQNLNAIQDQASEISTNIKSAQLGVERANLSREQAAVRDRRARQEATKARRDGIDDAEIVKTAQERLASATENVASAQRQVVLSNRNVRDALHAVAVAQREVADAQTEKKKATEGSTAADEAAKKAFADLAPAEKKLFGSLKRIRETFKRVFSGTSERDGILGPITLSISRLIDNLTKMLLDPRLQKAAGKLASAIADGIDKFAKFVSDPAFRNDLIFFIEQATKSIPTVIEGMLNLFQVFLDIARAATPIFNRLLDKFVGATDRAKGFTSQKGEVRRPEEGAVGQVAIINESRLDKFFSLAGEHLDSWIKLGAAIGNLIFAITSSAAAGSGKTLIERITDQLNEWADWIRENQESVQKFFDRSVESITNLARVLGRLTEALVKAFSSDEFLAFAEVMAEIIIPGLIGLIGFLGKASQVLLFLLDIPVVGTILKFALAFLVFEKGLNKLFPFTQKITDSIKALGKAAFTAFRVLGLRGALTYFRLAVRDAMLAVRRLVTSMFLLARTAAVAAFGALKRLAALIGGALLNALKLLRISVRGLVASTGIGALILAGILLIENWDKVKKYARIFADFLERTFKRVVSWVKENWKKLLIGAILAPFLITGILVTTLLRFRDKILGVFKTVASAIKNAFREAFKFIREKFNDIIGFIKGAYDKLPGPLKAIIRGAGKVAGVAGKAAGALGSAGGAAKDLLFRGSGGTVPGSGVLDSVPAMLTPGEWVLNKPQQERLAKIFGTTAQQLKATLFGTNSKVPPGQARLARDNPNRRKLPPGQARMARKVLNYSDFNLVSQEDPDGNTVWFLELANGSFGQVTARDATKIQSSRGTWIPNYVKRSVGGFNQNIKSIVTNGFSMGGIVTPAAVQRFATGGVVQNPGYGNTSNKNVVQNFNVNTQGSTDWGYVMRLGAISAQESF